MRKLILAAAVLSGVVAAAPSKVVAQDALGGALLGAGAGAIVGGIATGRGEGAAIGAAIGGVTGAAIGSANARPRRYAPPPPRYVVRERYAPRPAMRCWYNRYGEQVCRYR